MAGAARYTAVLDANVLYPRLMRDLLLSLAHADLYNAKWTEEIEREWTTALARDLPTEAANMHRVTAAMARAIPDCMITGHMTIVDSLQLPDPDDRHVLAAAIVGHADAIVTSNAQDFPQAILDQFGIERQSPDEFVVNQIMLHKVKALSVIKRMRERWNRPAVGGNELLALLSQRQMPLTAAHLADAVDLI